MKAKQALKYQRVDYRDIKVIYGSGKHRTETVVRAVPKGTYVTCADSGTEHRDSSSNNPKTRRK